MASSRSSRSQAKRKKQANRSNPLHTEQLLGEDSSVWRSVLPSGIRVITETMPSLASETVGVWVDSGSRDETDLTAGSTHFLEHMLFKGTTSRSAKQIAQIFDRTGGESNAVTSKEYTCYFSRCLVDDLPPVTDLLWDMVLHATLDAGEFERERGVIIEELAMAADDPTDVLYEKFDALVYPGHPLGRPVGATKDQIRTLAHTVLREHYETAYIGPRLVFTAAGGATHEQIVELVTKATAHLPQAAPEVVRPSRVAPEFASGTACIGKDTEQQGIIIGMPGLSEGDERRFAFSVMFSLLGGGMSSRLFQSVREDRGLAYSVHGIASRYSDSGQFGMYAGCAPQAAQDVIDLCVAEFERLASDLPGEEEVADIVAQAAGSMMLSLESSAVRMNRLARSELAGLPLESPQNLLDTVRKVTPADVSAIAADLAAGPRALVTLGPRGDLRLPQ